MDLAGHADLRLDAPMASTKQRKHKPYVWVFQLGSNAKVGKRRIPAAFGAACCYSYRKEHDRHTKRLGAIDEPGVADDEAELTFAAIDAFVERCELKRELYTDPEIEADKEHTEERGFHAGATFDEATIALVQGGFVLARMADPLAVPAVKLTAADQLAAIERDLDLTTLDLVLQRVASGEALTFHASAAEGLLAHAFAAGEPASVVAGITEAAPSWHPELRDTLLVLTGRLALTTPSARALVTTLPAPTDARVATLLAGWGLVPGGSALATKAKAKPQPKAKPVVPPAATKPAPTPAAVIARIEAAAKRAGLKLPKGATATAIAAAEASLGMALPAEVRAFYLAHDGGPPNALVCGGRELLSLARMVRQWRSWKEAFDAGAFDEDVDPDEGVQGVGWIPQWIPITHDFGGNHDMIDLAPAKGGTMGQIVAVWHDDVARTIEGDGLLSWLEARVWGKAA